MKHSDKLNLDYSVDSNKNVVFEDKVKYTPKEMVFLKGCGDEQLKAVHKIKKEFGGVVCL